MQSLNQKKKEKERENRPLSLMSKQTKGFSPAFHYVWLDNAEKKLLGALEDIHNVCFAIIEGITIKAFIFVFPQLLCLRYE